MKTEILRAAAARAEESEFTVALEIHGYGIRISARRWAGEAVGVISRGVTFDTIDATAPGLNALVEEIEIVERALRERGPL